MTITLQIDVHGWWQSGSGRGDGKLADSLAHRDADGLPELTGAQVKGLIRSVLETGIHAGVVEPSEVADWLGSSLPAEGSRDEAVEALEAARYTSTAGSWAFTAATLGPDWRRWARSTDGDPNALFSLVARTRLDAHGVAVDHTLRTIEVVAPMTLTAEIHGPDARGVEALETCLPWLRAVGSGRNRGLGRCTVTIRPGGAQ